MTISHDAQDASSTVLPLSGSSAEGRPAFTPIIEIADTFSSLGDAAGAVVDGLAAKRESLDAELFDLIARHGQAIAEFEAADEAWKVSRKAYLAAEPPVPAVLLWRSTDRFPHPCGRIAIEGSTSRFSFYENIDVERLRRMPVPTFEQWVGKPAPWGGGEEVGHFVRVPDEGAIARRAEIIGAAEIWEVKKEAVRDSSGLTAANVRTGAAIKAMNDAEDAALDYVPRTFAGLQAKARWIAGGGLDANGAKIVMRDICQMPPLIMPSSSWPLDRRPDRRALDAYREWLRTEGELLGAEMYPELGNYAHRHSPCGTAGGRFFHHPVPASEAPSTRAERMCTLLGIDWRQDEPLDDRGCPLETSAERAA